MRELKFRLYDLTMGMYRVLDSQHDTFFIRGDGSLEYYNLQNGSGGSEYVIEQFTGLLDKNGKPIYENDVVRLSDNVYGLYYGPGQIVVIEWDEDATGFKPFMDENSDYDGVSGIMCEVIGTIHDAEYKELAK